MDFDQDPNRLEPKVLRVFPDYGADPVWSDEGMVDLSSLAISDDLETELRRWNSEWESLVGTSSERFRIIDRSGREKWERLGRCLADRLQSELGVNFYVIYDGR